MSVTFENPAASASPEEPKPPVKKHHPWMAPIVAGVVGLGLGGGIVGAANSNNQPLAQPPVTMTVPGPVTTQTARIHVTETVKVPGPTQTVVDTAKVEAIHKVSDKMFLDGDRLYGLAYDVLQMMPDALSAAAAQDASTLNRINTKLQAALPQIKDARADFEADAAELMRLTDGQITAPGNVN